MTTGPLSTFSNNPKLQLQQMGEALKVDPYLVVVSAAAEVANARVWSFRVCDRSKRPIAGRFLLHIWYSTAEYGAPTAGLALAFTTGTLQRAITANQDVEIITNGVGLVEITATIAGVATYYAMVEARHIDVSSAVAWV